MSLTPSSPPTQAFPRSSERDFSQSHQPRVQLPFLRFQNPTTVDSLILCVRGGSYGHASIFDRVGKRLVADPLSVHLFLDAQRMDRSLEDDVLFRASVFSSPNVCVPAIIEAPVAYNVSVGPLATIDILRHRFRRMMAEKTVLLPILVVDTKLSHTRSRGDEQLVNPRGPVELLENASRQHIDTIPVSDGTFEGDLRAGIRRIFDEKNIVPAQRI